MIALWLVACTSGGLDITSPIDGADVEPDDSDAPSSEAALVGSWRSAGADIAPLLVDVVRVDATFEADGSYEVLTLLGDDSTWTLVGTWTSDLSTDPAAIALSQTSPWADAVEGIWGVDGDVLTWDVVSVALGSPATPGGGFGSSSAGDDNVQTYRRRSAP
jgi:hypothetical protein